MGNWFGPLLIFIAGAIALAARRLRHYQPEKAARRCPQESPTAAELLRGHAASRLVAGGTQALTRPWMPLKKEKEFGRTVRPSLFPQPHSRALFAPREGMLVLPWRLGEPSLASASPEDFIRDVLGPRMLAAEPRRGGRRRQIVLDVGANTGQFSMSVQRASLDGIAFEPEPTTCEALKRNVESDRSAQGFAGRYGSVTVHCAAVGSQMGSVTIRTRGPNRPATLQTVKQVSLDDVLELVPGAPVYRQRILLLKSDTQGYELDVLFGATNILMRHAARLLLLELSHKLLHDAGASPLQLLNEVSNAGYDCTMLALWGPRLSPSTGMVEFKQLPLPAEYLCRASGVISFGDLSELLARTKLAPWQNGTGWTDLLCWPAVQ